MKRKAVAITSIAVAVAAVTAVIASGAAIAAGESEPPEVLTASSDSVINEVAKSFESASISYDSVGISEDGDSLEIVVSYESDVDDATFLAEGLADGLNVDVSAVDVGPEPGKVILNNGHEVTVPLLPVEP